MEKKKVSYILCYPEIPVTQRYSLVQKEVKEKLLVRHCLMSYLN